MKKVTTITLCTLLFLLSCKQTTENFHTEYLNANNLPVQNFLINTKRDTTLFTDKGIKIFIPANSIEGKDKTITLQVKEALSLEDILKAGLTTKSDTEILSSDGMFYISTKENTVITTPLEISLPTFFADVNMHLYKGREENKNIIWKDPVAIDKTVSSTTDTGKILFISHCSACHSIDKNLTGPALAWVDKRNVDEKTMYAFIRNTEKLIAENKYYKCLQCKYGVVMTKFPLLSDTAINTIIRYIDKESKRLKIPEDFNSNSSCDSCDYYNKYAVALINIRDSIEKNNNTMSETVVIQPSDADPNADKGSIPIKVNPPIYNAEYYQFKINAFGWYNIDDVVDSKFGAEESKLTVSISGNFPDRLNIFLVIPSYKIFSEGGLLENGKDWGFYINNGEIFLPQKAKAFVFAISEQNSKLYYGQKWFTTSTSQHLYLSLYAISKEKMLKSFGSVKLDSLNLQVEKSKNFDQLTHIDSLLQSIKIKTSNCDCSGQTDSSAGSFSKAKK